MAATNAPQPSPQTPKAAKRRMLGSVILAAAIGSAAGLSAQEGSGLSFGGAAGVADPAGLSAATAAGAAPEVAQADPGLFDEGGLLDANNPDLVFTLRLGAQAQSPYFGSDEIEWGPDVGFRFDFLRFPNGFEYGSGRAVGFREGLGLRGAVRYIPGRSASDHPELAGLDDIDWAWEFGLGVGYEQRNYRLFGDLRYGAIGHNSFVGELGADVILRPAEGWTITAGPRVTLGSDRYTDTYFGVSAAESGASGLPAYDPDGGAVEAGVELSARYAFNERWGVEGILSYSKFVGDAADSPIVLQGTDDYLKLEVGLTRRVSLDF
ncbi:MltA-interacting protein precursor [Pseudoruegeria aquimaris]|uniref:MltA-interacting protein n=1 Tax=Pseudoruegeria aquimaris TaxID=393663 RepID=A0A1Y5RKV6_9RHOB|nr:MipA/OmpV family protein [Pseudoruegeria aquimaris]SLN16978.1 MltA-interacting protein precursor [Pseudoruegeria aquimaris]